MTPLVLVFAVLVLASAKTLASIYLGEKYVCPTCGTTRQDQHSDECPWKR